MAHYGVALASEGPTDIGELANAYATWEETQEGFLQHLICRCLPQHDFQFFDGSAITLDLDFGDIDRGLEGKARQAGALAAYSNAHAVVYVVDADNDPDPVKHRLEPIIRGLEEGASVLGDPVPRTIGAIAHKTIEAWVLSDPHAVQATAGARFTGPVPAQPEALWGKPNDPKSNHPKQVLRRVFSGNVGRADYAEVGERIDPDIVATRCPTGFAPFRDLLVQACP